MSAKEVAFICNPKFTVQMNCWPNLKKKRERRNNKRRKKQGRNNNIKRSHREYDKLTNSGASPPPS
jgi:hypothetical protein